MSYFRLNWKAELKKNFKFNFGAAMSQKYASGSVKQEWVHKSQVKNKKKKIFFKYFSAGRSFLDVPIYVKICIYYYYLFINKFKKKILFSFHIL